MFFLAALSKQCSAALAIDSIDCAASGIAGAVSCITRGAALGMAVAARL
eukprot:CAMPEP_0172697834 /NCGR_PEP_ID=MMETSP1074-20121228/29020_1 /TAXON_ID=2916 /ORGANISM="Ceratium fusus, Strain PA161109" /LENGTH=48 /DNA_ID= /DNA_START= /DNA_END= /DNA_ORIENTATION=